jgi:hypothetical protein
LVFVLPGKQAGVAHHVFVELPADSVAQKETGLGRKAYTEFGDDVGGQTSGMQVFACVRRFRALELLLKERAGSLVDIEQAAALLRLASFFRR